MRLTALEVNQLPGITQQLRVSELLPGVNVIVGPNASGKSSLVRALLALLYPREHDGVMEVEARFLTAAGSSLAGRRLGKDVGWERDGRPTAAPALPAFHLVGTYTIRLEDLVAAGDPTQQAPRGTVRPPATATAGSGAGADLDRRITESIVKQLTGGIDLDAVRRSLGKQAEAGKRLAAAVSAASKELAALDKRRTALSVREAELPAQYQELVAARESAGRRHLISDAEQLLAARAEADQLAAELRSFPPDLDKLRGDEDESLAKLTAAARAETDKAAALELELAAVTAALAASALRSDLTSSEVRVQLERADELVADAAKLEHKVTERRSLQAQLREAARRAGAAADERSVPGGGQTQRLDAAGAALLVSDETIERVEELLQRRQSATAEADALMNQLGRLPPPAPAADGVSEDQLVRLRANLLRWCSAPPVEPRRPAWAWGIALALVTSLVAAGSLGATATVLLALAGATGMWLLLVALLVPPLASAVRRQVEAETSQAHIQHGVTGPRRWEHAEVTELIVSIDGELAARRRNAVDDRQRSDAARVIEADLATVRSRLDEAQVELEAVRAANGFAPGPQVLLASWLHAVRDLDRLRVASAGVEVEGARLAERIKRARTSLLAVLDAAGPAGPASRAPGALSAEELRTAVRGLARAIEQRDADQRLLASLSADRDRCIAELARLVDERRRLLTGVGLDDRPDVADELRRRLAALPGWREVDRRLRASQARIETLERRLTGEEELLTKVAARDHRAIEEAAAECGAAQSRAEELSRLISQTEREIELAASDRSIGQATARLEQALEELSAHRDEAMRLASAHFLVDAVEAEHRSEARPPALARAAVLFERFTRGEFLLRFEGDGSRRRLAAGDRSGRLVELNELSTGTRAQLLIASRLAFALEAEVAAGGAHGESAQPLGLPFFLDEALTTSDPERFAAVASAILDVAALEGRQFIYLSARSDDAELWQRAADAHGSTIGVVQLGSQGAGKAASPAAN